MAISSTSSQSPGSGIWSQIQQQQAQRNADQAEQQARALQARAREAQSAADRAQENARSLQVESSQAQGEAESARRGLASIRSRDEFLTRLSGQVEKISAALTKPTEVVQPSSVAVAQPVVNAYGQATGTTVNVTA
jgi:hypothetical protein